MAAPSVIQPAFNSGEWAPSLYARVDLAKWRTGCALAENFFVDYRGGLSSRAGTKNVIQAYDSSGAVRLIPFQASVDVGYALEFGDGYIRFHYQGEPVLEPAFNITAATQANPCTLTIPGHNYAVGDWILVNGVVGMTQLNGRYFVVRTVVGDDITLRNMFGNNVNSSSYDVYSSGGTSRKVYTISSPYTSDELFGIKFVQQVSSLILCHPNYEPYILTLNTALDWTLSAIVIGTTVGQTSSVAVTTTLGADNWNYSYAVCGVDENGQESAPVYGTLASREDIRTNSGTNTITWAAIPGAVSYNVYKAELSKNTAVPTGAPHGFIGNATGVDLIDSNIGPDYSVTPPVARNPFVGGNVLFATVTSPGASYAVVPTVTFTGTATVDATGLAVLQVQGTPTVNVQGTGYAVGDRVYFRYGIVVVVAAETGGQVTAIEPITVPGSNPGAFSTGIPPSNPGSSQGTSGSGNGLRIGVVWGVGAVQITNAGIGYDTAPTISFSTGTATAVATISDIDVGFPLVPAFYQQRLWFMGKSNSPQGFDVSQPGSFFNFDTYNPIQPDAAISGTLVSGILNTIRAAVPMQNGLVVFSDRMSWVINGGSAGSAVSAIDVVANPQAYNGISDVPPIVANGDILYVQAKGSIVRNLAYNFYTNNYIGTDVSAISSHLFFGYSVVDWAWAEEPFKLAWGVRDDGALLSFTFLKEQEFAAWTHSVTEGDFKSVCTVVEGTENGNVDAIYVVVEREVAGETLKFIERMADRFLDGGAQDAWCVDAGVGYDGAPTSSFVGGEHLRGLTVTGLADGEVITPFEMPVTGQFTLPTPASKVSVGRSFTCKLQTLPLDIGEPTVQGKPKKISGVDVRVKDTLGLKIGQDFDHLVTMKDLVVGAVGSMLTGLNPPRQQVTGLFTGDVRTFLSPAYTIWGQYCIQQDLPLPASILGVIPQITIGDTPK